LPPAVMMLLRMAFSSRKWHESGCCPTES
jgi:hypothetical protein